MRDSLVLALTDRINKDKRINDDKLSEKIAHPL